MISFITMASILSSRPSISNVTVLTHLHTTSFPSTAFTARALATIPKIRVDQRCSTPCIDEGSCFLAFHQYFYSWLRSVTSHHWLEEVTAGAPVTLYLFPCEYYLTKCPGLPPRFDWLFAVLKQVWTPTIETPVAKPFTRPRSPINLPWLFTDSWLYRRYHFCSLLNCQHPGSRDQFADPQRFYIRQLLQGHRNTFWKPLTKFSFTV